MQLWGTHIAVFKAIPENKAKEYVSYAYLRAIVAQAGLNVKSPEWDDGVDLEIGSTKPVVGGFIFRNLWITLQLKATENWEIKDGSLKFFLKQSNYDQLRSPSATDQYLVVYTLPPGGCRQQWVVQQPECIQFASRAFYLSLKNAQPLTPRSDGRSRFGKTVTIPTSNRLTASSLRTLYVDAARRYQSLMKA